MRATRAGAPLTGEFHNYLRDLSRAISSLETELRGRAEAESVAGLSSQARAQLAGERRLREAELAGVRGRFAQAAAERRVGAEENVTLAQRIAALERADFRAPVAVAPPGPPDTVIVVPPRVGRRRDALSNGAILTLGASPADSPFTATVDLIGPAPPAPYADVFPRYDFRRTLDVPSGAPWSAAERASAWTVTGTGTSGPSWRRHQNAVRTGYGFAGPCPPKTVAAHAQRECYILSESPGVVGSSLAAGWRFRCEFLDGAGDSVNVRASAPVETPRRGPDLTDAAALMDGAARAAAGFVDVPAVLRASAVPGHPHGDRPTTVVSVYLAGETVARLRLATTWGGVSVFGSYRATTGAIVQWSAQTLALFVAPVEGRRRAPRPTDPRTLRVRLYRMAPTG